MKNNNNNSDNNKKKKKVIIIATLSSVALLGGGLGAFFLAKQCSANKELRLNSYLKLQEKIKEADEFLSGSKLDNSESVLMDLSSENDSAKKVNQEDNLAKIEKQTKDLADKIEKANQKYKQLNDDNKKDFNNKADKLIQKIQNSDDLTNKQKEDFLSQINNIKTDLSNNPEADWKDFQKAINDLSRIENEVDKKIEDNKFLKSDLQNNIDTLKDSVKNSTDNNKEAIDQFTKKVNEIIDKYGGVNQIDDFPKVLKEIADAHDSIVYEFEKNKTPKEKYESALEKVNNLIESLNDSNKYPNLVEKLNNQKNNALLNSDSEHSTDEYMQATDELNQIYNGGLKDKLELDKQRNKYKDNVSKIEELIEKVKNVFNIQADEIKKALDEIRVSNEDLNNKNVAQIQEINDNLEQLFISANNKFKQTLTAKDTFDNAKKNLQDFIKKLNENDNQELIKQAQDLINNLTTKNENSQQSQTYLESAKEIRDFLKDNLSRVSESYDDNELENAIEAVKLFSQNYPDNTSVQEDTANKINEYSQYLNNSDESFKKQKADELRNWLEDYKNKVRQNDKAQDEYENNKNNLIKKIEKDLSDYPLTKNNLLNQVDKVDKNLPSSPVKQDYFDAIDKLKEISDSLNKHKSDLDLANSRFNFEKDQIQEWSNNNLKNYPSIKENFDKKVNDIIDTFNSNNNNENIAKINELIQELRDIKREAEEVVSVKGDYDKTLQIAKEIIDSISDKNTKENLSTQINTIDSQLNQKNPKNNEDYLNAKKEIEDLLLDSLKDKYQKTLEKAKEIAEEKNDDILKNKLNEIESQTNDSHKNAQLYIDQIQKIEDALLSSDIKKAIEDLQKSIDKANETNQKIGTANTNLFNDLNEFIKETIKQKNILEANNSKDVDKFKELKNQLEQKSQNIYDQAVNEEISEFEKAVNAAKDNSENSKLAPIWNSGVDKIKNDILDWNSVNNLNNLTPTQISSIKDEFNNQINKLQKVKDNLETKLTEVNNIIANESHKDYEPNLKDKVDKILQDLSHDFNKDNVVDSTKKIDDLIDEYNNKKALLDENKNLVNEAKQTLESIKDLTDQSAYNKLNDIINKNTATSANDSQEIALFNQNLVDAIADAQAEKRKNSNDSAASKQEFEKVKNEAESLIEKINQKGEEYADEANKLQEKINDLTAKTNQNDASVKDIENNIVELKKAIDIAKMDVAKQDLNNLISKLNQIYQNNASKNKENDNEYKNIQDQILSLLEKAKEASDETNPAQAEISYLNKAKKLQNDFDDLYNQLQNKSTNYLLEQINSYKFSPDQIESIIEDNFNNFVNSVRDEADRRIHNDNSDSDFYTPKPNNILDGVNEANSKIAPIKQKVIELSAAIKDFRDLLNADKKQDSNSIYPDKYLNDLSQLISTVDTSKININDLEKLIQDVNALKNNYLEEKENRNTIVADFNKVIVSVDSYHKFVTGISTTDLSSGILASEYQKAKALLDETKRALDSTQYSNEKLQEKINSAKNKLQEIVNNYKQSQNVITDAINNEVESLKLPENLDDTQQNKINKAYNKYIDEIVKSQDFSSADATLNPLVSKMLDFYKHKIDELIVPINDSKIVIDKSLENLNQYFNENLQDPKYGTIIQDINNKLNDILEPLALTTSPEKFKETAQKINDLISEAKKLKDVFDLNEEIASLNVLVNKNQSLINSLTNPNYQKIKNNFQGQLNEIDNSPNDTIEMVKRAKVRAEELYNNIQSEKQKIDQQIKSSKDKLQDQIQTSQAFVDSLDKSSDQLNKTAQKISAVITEAQNILNDNNSLIANIDQIRETLKSITDAEAGKSQKEILINDLDNQIQKILNDPGNGIIGGEESINLINEISKIKEELSNPNANIDELARRLKEALDNLKKFSDYRAKEIKDKLNDQVIDQAKTITQKDNEMLNGILDSYISPEPKQYETLLIRKSTINSIKGFNKFTSDMQNKYYQKLQQNPNDSIARLMVKSIESTAQQYSILAQQIINNPNSDNDDLFWDRSTQETVKKIISRFYNSGWAIGEYGLLPKIIGERLLIELEPYNFSSNSPSFIQLEFCGSYFLEQCPFYNNDLSRYTGNFWHPNSGVERAGSMDSSIIEAQRASRGIEFIFVNDGLIPYSTQAYLYIDRLNEIFYNLDENVKLWLSKIPKNEDKIQFIKGIEYLKQKYNKVIDNVLANIYTPTYNKNVSLVEAYNQKVQEFRDYVENTPANESIKKAMKDFANKVISKSSEQDINTLSDKQKLEMIVYLDKSLANLKTNKPGSNIQTWKLTDEALSDLSDPINASILVDIYRNFVEISQSLGTDNVKWLSRMTNKSVYAVVDSKNINRNLVDARFDYADKDTRTYREFMWSNDKDKQYKLYFSYVKDAIYTKFYNDTSLQRTASNIINTAQEQKNNGQIDEAIDTLKRFLTTQNIKF
ncbi:hypothetical protein V2E24_01865 [Mycoplasmopsis ciconiae]|uniref:Uncharacterized protein n=1 Tax=Mycoplasmopsis ciconiae TaxID=561067 RepID=A0ABU7ML99_9BACT|nr:hypothetical protein [Mycoplasmopsis ciconiae]